MVRILREAGTYVSHLAAVAAATCSRANVVVPVITVATTTAQTATATTTQRYNNITTKHRITQSTLYAEISA